MDFSKHSEFEAEKWCRLSHNSHRIIKVLLSFSLFSILIWGRPLFLQSLEPFLVQLDSYIIGKNYLFLLCNGILVLIAKSSGLINGSSSPSSNHGKELYIENPESSREELKVSESEERHEEIEWLEEDKCLIKVEEHGEELKNAFMIIGEYELDAEEPVFRENNVGIEYPEEVIKSLVMVGGKDDDDGVSEEECKNGTMVIWENELDEEEAEELNEKCEAFIRKMKTSFCSERRFDYQNALVPVY
ncbi:hypothetical protein L6164_028990 [Bauhinia variegata]|uniref:Uncharacterized protein n=1 Tax=Bauhinia variegata TaxID=167791 RepID=A0ACB9L7U8_BAUVA|nr:hypothetical protein L6164_028990 [Bauhinia variegata]